MNTTQNSTKSKIVKVIGVDLAKDHCDVIGYDENGKICLRLDGCSYAKLREILSNLPQAVVLMEACKGSMFHARSIADLGHEVRLVKGADVKALRNINHKNDLRDAAYIAKLYFVPGTTYVYIKSQQQQSLQFLQNEYKSLQELRIQAGNQIHAGLEEFGCPVRKSSKFIKTRMVAHLEKHAELIPEDVMASFKRRREIWLNLLQQEEEAKRLRSNLVQCAQLVLMYAEKWKGNFGDWVRKMRDSGKKHGVIVCAIAAKLARIIYRLMKDKVDYTPVLSC